MTFVERNKRWLLPTPGRGGGRASSGCNFPARSPRPRRTPRGRSPAPDDRGPGRGRRAGLPRLDQDFKALETRRPAPTTPPPCWQAGRRTLAAGRRSPPRPPELHPGLWSRLPRLPAPPRRPAGPGPRGRCPPPWSSSSRPALGPGGVDRRRGLPRRGAALEGGYTHQAHHGHRRGPGRPDRRGEPLEPGPPRPPGAAPGEHP